MNNVYYCIFCGKKFEVKYIQKGRNIKYCSKSCKSKYELKNGKNKIVKIKYHNKQQLERDIKKEIKLKGTYLTIQDILKALKISNKTLTKFKISVLSLNKECGFTKSKSIFEDLVFDYLKSKFAPSIIEREKIFESCKSIKGFDLRFDFYIKDINTIIEADGDQHKNIKNPYYSEMLIKNDEIKNKWCKDNGIKLIRIPYKRNITHEYLRDFI